MGHFQAVKRENVVGDAGRVYQAVRQYAETPLWNNSRNADTFAWLVTGLLQSQKSTLPEWVNHRQSKAVFAQSLRAPSPESNMTKLIPPSVP
jgi:hypothetical protein